MYNVSLLFLICITEQSSDCSLAMLLFSGILPLVFIPALSNLPRSNMADALSPSL